jgi:protein-tyrosine phosphatase
MNGPNKHHSKLDPTKCQVVAGRLTIESGIGSCTIEQARSCDVSTVMALRDDAARWLVGRGIEQWVPGELTVARFQRLITEASVWLMRHDDQIVGMVTVTWADPAIWDQREGQAGYIHTLVINRAFGGRHLGRYLLAWSEARITASGRELARLDCVRTNRELRRYYEDRGYHHVGYKDFPDIEWAREVALYEKPLTPSEPDER